VSIATVYRLCEAGKLPYVRVLNAVRVDEGDLRSCDKDKFHCNFPGGAISHKKLAKDNGRSAALRR